MTKIIRIILATVLAALMVLLAACGNTEPNKDDHTTTPSDNVGTSDIADTSDTSTPDTTPVEPEDPLKEQKAQVKQKVLAIMAEDDKESPTSLFEFFCGDYSIGFVADNNDFGASVNRIWQKDGVTAIEYKDGRTEYTLVRNGYQFKLVSREGNTEVTSVAAVTNPDKYVPSIFADFSIDISAIYSGAEDQTDVDDPPLSEDMLTVSEDLKTCTFSDEYMASVTDMLLTEMDYSEEDKVAFLAEYSGSGVYTAEDNSVVFIIKGKEKTLGDMTITVSYVQDDKNGYSMSTKMEYTITAEGISIPTSNELIIRDVKYDGNTPVSATVESRVLEQNATIVSEGLTYTVNTSNISLFYLDTQTPTLNVNIMQQSDTAVAGQTVSQSAQIDLMLKQRSLS